ncbi:hypothetical protein ACFLV5_04135 [Chloroflexota bacterium]
MKNLTLDRMRGSLLRCMLLTGQTPHKTAELLTNLISLPNVVVSSRDHWMPHGLRDYKETTLVDGSYFLSTDKCRALTEWWLEKARGARLPNWDIVSTCTIEGMGGLLLVEAKAHDKELSKAGKSQPTTTNSQLNHRRIGLAIAQANSGLNGVLQGWTLSRDSHYQISNRFAWAWKLTTLGVPTILVYLGFLNATEMLDQGQPFNSSKVWQACIRDHAKAIVPEEAWDKTLEIGGTPVWFLIRSMQIKLEVVD